MSKALALIALILSLLIIILSFASCGTQKAGCNYPKGFTHKKAIG